VYNYGITQINVEKKVVDFIDTSQNDDFFLCETL